MADSTAEHLANVTSRVDQLQSRVELVERTSLILTLAILAVAVGALWESFARPDR